jgi:hypothetical protein
MIIEDGVQDWQFAAVRAFLSDAMQKVTLRPDECFALSVHAVRPCADIPQANLFDFGLLIFSDQSTEDEYADES